MTLHPERDLRQRDIVPPERLAACKATVIGVGAIGRQVALQLAAIGVPHLQFIDFDTVEPVNLAVALISPQGLRPFIVNWHEVAAHFLRGVRNDADMDGTPETIALLTHLSALAEHSLLSEYPRRARHRSCRSTSTR